MITPVSSLKYVVDHVYGTTGNIKSMLQTLTYNKTVLFVCIGSMKVVGDSFGPLVGSILSDSGYDVIGTVDEPLHALNLPKVYLEISKLPYDLVIAIDAGVVVKACDVGFLQLLDCPLKPGRAYGKVLPEIGDIALLGLVDHGSTANLSTTSFRTVYALAQFTTDIIKRSVPRPYSPLYSNILRSRLPKLAPENTQTAFMVLVKKILSIIK